ncbi:MAG: hypothetical protein NT144_08695, partial [Bacteroidia bacterium]|nr:hypothetical protein [Bacteroidia bacterium]
MNFPVKCIIISALILCHSFNNIIGQNKKLTVNKTGTGYYQLECKAVPDNSLTYRLTGINKQVALSPNPKVPFMWRK